MKERAENTRQFDVGRGKVPPPKNGLPRCLQSGVMGVWEGHHQHPEPFWRIPTEPPKRIPASRCCCGPACWVPPAQTPGSHQVPEFLRAGCRRCVGPPWGCVCVLVGEVWVCRGVCGCVCCVKTLCSLCLALKSTSCFSEGLSQFLLIERGPVSPQVPSCGFPAWGHPSSLGAS